MFICKLIYDITNQVVQSINSIHDFNIVKLSCLKHIQSWYFLMIVNYLLNMFIFMI